MMFRYVPAGALHGDRAIRSCRVNADAALIVNGDARRVVRAGKVQAWSWRRRGKHAAFLDAVLVLEDEISGIVRGSLHDDVAVVDFEFRAGSCGADAHSSIVANDELRDEAGAGLGTDLQVVGAGLGRADAKLHGTPSSSAGASNLQRRAFVLAERVHEHRLRSEQAGVALHAQVAFHPHEVGRCDEGWRRGSILEAQQSFRSLDGRRDGPDRHAESCCLILVGGGALLELTGLRSDGIRTPSDIAKRDQPALIRACGGEGLMRNGRVGDQWIGRVERVECFLRPNARARDDNIVALRCIVALSDFERVSLERACEVVAGSARGETGGGFLRWDFAITKPNFDHAAVGFVLERIVDELLEQVGRNAGGSQEHDGAAESVPRESRLDEDEHLAAGTVNFLDAEADGNAPRVGVEEVARAGDSGVVEGGGKILGSEVLALEELRPHELVCRHSLASYCSGILFTDGADKPVDGHLLLVDRFLKLGHLAAQRLEPRILLALMNDSAGRDVAAGFRKGRDRLGREDGGEDRGHQVICNRDRERVGEIGLPQEGLAVGIVEARGGIRDGFDTARRGRAGAGKGSERNRGECSAVLIGWTVDRLERLKSAFTPVVTLSPRTGRTLQQTRASALRRLRTSGSHESQY